MSLNKYIPVDVHSIRRTALYVKNNLKGSSLESLIDLCESIKIEVSFRNNYKKDNLYGLSTKLYGVDCIFINNNLSNRAKKIILAHEIGHIILEHDGSNSFKANNPRKEFEANFFAINLLFDQKDFNVNFTSMNEFLINKVIEANTKFI